MSKAIEKTTLADKLIELRKTRGLSQKQLAELLGTNQVTLARIESGSANPSWGFITRIADALHAEIGITFTLLDNEEDFSRQVAGTGNEFICVNCSHHWKSESNRPVLQCPKCRKRYGVRYSVYSKLIEIFLEAKAGVQASPPFQKAPPVRLIAKKIKQTLEQMKSTVGSTFPSPQLPIRLLLKIWERARQDQKPQKTKQ